MPSKPRWVKCVLCGKSLELTATQQRIQDEAADVGEVIEFSCSGCNFDLEMMKEG